MIELVSHSYDDNMEHRVAIHIRIPLTGIKKPYSELPAWRQKRRDKNKIFFA